MKSSSLTQLVDEQLVRARDASSGRGAVTVHGGQEHDLRQTVIALVEPRMVERARTAAAALDAERIVVEPGDITDPKLGLSDRDRKSVV